MSNNKANPLVSCQCGAITFHTSLPKPQAMYICHCTECRKQSSSAFGTSAVFPSAGMWPLPEAIQPKLGLWTRGTDRGNTLECYFCKECGVRVLHRGIKKDGTPKDVLIVKGGALQGFNLDGATHIWTKSAVVPVPEGSWLESPEGSEDEGEK